MSEMHKNFLKTTFIFVVLQINTRMCVTKKPDRMSDKELQDSEVVPEELIKRLIGEDVGTRVTTRRARHPPSYLLLLYNSLEGFEDMKHGLDDAFPKIRAYRGLKGRESQREQQITFPLSNVKWNAVGRMEIAIKLNNKIRRRSAARLKLKIILVVHAGNNDTVGVGAQLYENYLIFDTSPLKVTNRSSISIEKSLLVNGKKIRISRRNEPLLLIYEHVKQNPLLKRARRHTNHLQSLYAPESGQTDMFSCRKYDWNIDVSVFEFSWWLQPRTYNAGICSGECSFPLNIDETNSTSYSLMKNIWHYQTHFMNEIVPRASCVPVDYSPLQILYINNNIETSIILVSDMKVKSCGCR